MNIKHPKLLLPIIFLMALLSWNPATAQTSFEDFQKQGGLESGLNDLAARNVISSNDPVAFSTYYKLKTGSQEGYVYVEAEISPGWHVYSQTTPEGGPMRSKIRLAESEEYTLIGNWEPDHPPHIGRQEGFDVDIEQFETKVVWSAPIEFAEGVNAKEADLNIKYKGQTCDDGGCLPLSETLIANYVDEAETREVVRSEIVEIAETERKKKVVEESAEEQAEIAKLYDPTQAIQYEKLDGSSGKGTFWAALIGAFLGGMILNLMPCVFPVLGIKVLGFVEQAGNDPKKIRMHGLAFAAGLIASMWALAAFIFAIKYGLLEQFGFGTEVNWGEQMRYPIFIGGIVIMLFVLGLNLAGVFEIGLFMTRVGAGKKKSGYMGSFISGIITTIVATPCSGPFLGTAMAYTFAQPWYIALLLFTVFGLGISVPYVALSFMPKMINLLPKPGEWMETFKKLMAFTLFGAAAFFLQAFGTQTGVNGMSWFLMGLCIISLGAYFYGKWSPGYIDAKQRYVWGIIAPLILVGAGGYMYVQASQMKAPAVAVSDEWVPWIPGRVEQQLAMGKPVWVDYTADW